MQSELTAQIHQYLTTAPSSLFAQQEVEILAQWEGDANLLWRVKVEKEDAVVKLFLDAGRARSRRQFDGHLIFAPLGLAPHPLWADRYPHGLSRQVIVYRWSDGVNIETEEKMALWSWAEAVATLHTTPPDDVRRVSPHPLTLDYYWRIEQGSIRQIEKWLQSSGLPLIATFRAMANTAASLVIGSLYLWEYAIPTAVHGDLALEHTLTERGRILFVDWEMFGLGDPALEVARLLQHEAQLLTPELRDEWLNAYLQTMQDPDLTQRIAIYQRLLEFYNVVYLLVGLQQNASGPLESDLLDALPFMQNTLTSALDKAALALQLPVPPDSASISASFFEWLIMSAPAAR